MDELLARMMAALEVRGKRPATRKAYTRCVRRLIEHHGGRDPSELAPEDVEQFLLHLTRTAHLQARTRNVYSSALRFLYTVVLRRPDIAGTIARARVPHRVPVVLSPDEVARLLSALRTPLQRTVATVCYGAGLRIGEADSVVISVINNGVIGAKDVVCTPAGAALKAAGRKKLILAFERRMDQLVTHPVFGYRISYRRMLEVQARLMARLITAEIEVFPNIRVR